MSVEITLPALHKAISASKDLDFDNPQRYISVVNGHAIISNSVAVLVFNLDDYFNNYEDLKPDETHYYNELVEWMNGKFFSKEFWNEISGTKTISVIDSSTLRVEDANVKNLSYTHHNVNIQGILKMLNYNAKTQPIPYPASAFSKACYTFIDKAVGKQIGTSSIITEFVEKEKPARWIADKNFYVFGLFMPNHAATEAAFNFEPLNEFCENLNLE